jgi:hypothetical protein
MATKDEKALSLVLEKFNDSKEKFEIIFQNFNEYEKLYFGHIDSTKTPWKSKVFDPETFEKVERMSSHLTASAPRGTVLPQDWKDVGDLFGATAINEIFKFQWNNPKAHMRRKITDVIKSMAMFGSGFGTLHWRFEQKDQKFEVEGEVRTEKVTTFDAPMFKPIYIYDAYPDPAATNIEDMQYFIQVDYTTMQELKAANKGVNGKGRYKNLEELAEAIKNDSTATEESFRTEVDRLKFQTSDSLKNRVKLYRYYSKEKWITVAADFDILIENRPNPYIHGELPIHKVDDHTYPNQLYGTGEVQPIASLQRGLNWMLNARIDNVNMAMNPMFQTVKGDKFAHTWKIKPGQKWMVERQGNVQPFQFPDVTANTHTQISNYFKDSIARTLGNFDVLTRNETSNERTATEVNAIEGEQNARLRQKEGNVDEFIKRLVDQWIKLNQQYLTANKMIRIVGREALDLFQTMESLRELPETELDPVTQQPLPQDPELEIESLPFKTVTIEGQTVPKLQVSPDRQFGFLGLAPEDIQGNFDFKAESGSTTDPDSQREQENLALAIQQLQVLEPSLEAQGVTINYVPLATQQLLQAGVKDVDEVFQSAPPPEQLPEGGLPQGAPVLA